MNEPHHDQPIIAQTASYPEPAAPTTNLPNPAERTAGQPGQPNLSEAFAQSEANALARRGTARRSARSLPSQPTVGTASSPLPQAAQPAPSPAAATRQAVGL